MWNDLRSHSMGPDPSLLAPVYWERGSLWNAGGAPWENTQDPVPSSGAGSAVADLTVITYRMAWSLWIGPEDRLCPTVRSFIDQARPLDTAGQVRVSGEGGWWWEQGGSRGGEDTGGSESLRKQQPLLWRVADSPVGHAWAGSPGPPLACPHRGGGGARPPGTV